MITYVSVFKLKYLNGTACFLKFSANRTCTLMYDVYTNESYHRICFPTEVWLPKKFEKIEHLKKIAVVILKFEQFGFIIRLMYPKDADSMAIKQCRP